MFKKPYMQFSFQKHKAVISKLEFSSPYSQLHYHFKIVSIGFLFLHSVHITDNLLFFALPMSKSTTHPCNKSSFLIILFPYNSQLIVTLQKLHLKKSHFIKYCQKTKEQNTAEKKNGHQDIYCWGMCAVFFAVCCIYWKINGRSPPVWLLCDKLLL